MLDGDNVLVTGGAGFVGSQLVETLSEDGANLLAIDNCFAGSDSLVPDGVRFERTDIRDDSLPELVREFDPDTILHLAALHYIPYCNDHPEETFQVNVMGTRNLLEAAGEASNLSTVVFASTAAVYPPREGPNAEGSPTGPMDIYGETKLVGEDLMQLFARRTGISTVSARLFNVFGTNETNDHLIPAIVEQVRRGDRKIDLGNLTPKRDFVHVSDVVEAITTLAQEFQGGYDTYNVGTGTEYSVREVVEQTSEALGEEIEIDQDDDRVRESDRPHLQADISRLRREFGWEPSVDLVTGLEELLHQEEAVLVT